MKSSETKTKCPVCNAVVSSENINKHLAQMARREWESNLQKSKKHYNYYETKITSGKYISGISKN